MVRHSPLEVPHSMGYAWTPPLVRLARQGFVSWRCYGYCRRQYRHIDLERQATQEFPLELAQQLDVLKEASQDADEDLVTDFAYAGERLFIKPHGAGKQ